MESLNKIIPYRLHVDRSDFDKYRVMVVSELPVYWLEMLEDEDGTVEKMTISGKAHFQLSPKII